MSKYHRFFMEKYFLFLLLFVETAVAKPLKVVATVPFLVDLMENTTCRHSHYEVQSLIPVGVDPHTYVLTPQDRIALKNADLVLQIGAHLEPWLGKIPMEAKQGRLVLSEHLPLRKIQSQNSSPLSEFDPHIWQSPQLTQKAAQVLKGYLSLKSSQDKDFLETCTQKYLEKIQSTVVDLKKQVGTIPVQNRVIATNHDSLSYFAEAFGFQIYSILGLSDEAEPSFQQMQNLISILKQKHIKSVFLESTGQTKNMETIAENAHIAVGGKLYGDSFGTLKSGANTTLGLWQSNVSTLVKALK